MPGKSDLKKSHINPSTSKKVEQMEDSENQKRKSDAVERHFSQFNRRPTRPTLPGLKERGKVRSLKHPTLKEDPTFARALEAADSISVQRMKYSTPSVKEHLQVTYGMELEQNHPKSKPKMIRDAQPYNLGSNGTKTHKIYLYCPPSNFMSVKEHSILGSKKKHELDRFSYLKYIQEK